MYIYVHVLGQFTLRDMYEQFQNIMKMGPFNQIIVSNITVCIDLYSNVHVHMLYFVFVVGHDSRIQSRFHEQRQRERKHGQIETAHDHDGQHERPG